MEKILLSSKRPSEVQHYVSTSSTDSTVRDTDEFVSTKKRENSQHPTFPANAKLSDTSNCEKTEIAPHMQEGQGDAIIKTDDRGTELVTDGPIGKGMASHTGVRSDEDWIMISEESSEKDTEIGHGCYVVPHSSSSSFLDVTSESLPYQAEPSPQISSTSVSRTSINSSCYSDDDQYVRAARPSPATDRFDTGPWNDYSDLPAVPICSQYFDYHQSYNTDENFLENGYKSPVSDDDTFFSCREDLSKKSDEILTTNCSVGCDTKYSQEREKGNEPPDKNQRKSVADEFAIEEASFELTNQVLNMSLNALDASTPSENTMASTLNSNTAGNESGFYDGGFTSSEHHVFNLRPALSVNRTVDIHIEVKETPEEIQTLMSDSLVYDDSIRMKILSETPMSDEMSLCNTHEQTPSGLSQSRRPENMNHSSQENLRFVNHQRELMSIADEEQQNMVCMLREAKRARDEFDTLRKTVDKIIQRMAETGITA